MKNIVTNHVCSTKESHAFRVICYSVQVRGGGAGPFPGATPVPGLFRILWSQVVYWEYPSPRFFPSLWFQVIFWGGTPVPARGYPREDRVPQLGLGYPRDSDWAIPPPPRHNKRASTCYAVGTMPLAVTQEDFLVFLGVFK